MARKSLTGLDANSKVISHVATPVATTDATPKSYVVSQLTKAGMSGATLLWTTGRYYGSGMLNTSSTVGATNGRIYLTPMFFPVPRSIDQIGINVSTAGTSGQLARLGIYDSDPTTFLPVNPLVDSGTFLVDTIGGKTFTTSQTLEGLYWLALVAQGGTFTAWASSTAIGYVTGATSLSSPGGSVVVGKDSVTVTSALPVLSSLTYGSVSTPPAVLVRAA